MQHTHRLSLLAGHMLIDLPEGRFLVDTGSTESFGDAGSASYGGEKRVLPRAAGGIDLSMLAGLGLEARIGARLRGVLGMDILGAHPVQWDAVRGRAIVRGSAPSAGYPRVAMEFESNSRVPIVRAQVGDRALRFVFDTGAQFGYLAVPPVQWTGELGADGGPFDDHHPVLGAIRSSSIKCPVVLGAEGGATARVRERFGFHERLATEVLRPLGLDGILGCSWLPNRSVWFMPSERLLVIGALSTG